MSTKNPFDFPDSTKSQLAAMRVAFARERRLSAKLTSELYDARGELADAIADRDEERDLRARAVLATIELHKASRLGALSEAIASGLRRGLGRGLGGAS